MVCTCEYSCTATWCQYLTFQIEHFMQMVFKSPFENVKLDSNLANVYIGTVSTIAKDCVNSAASFSPKYEVDQCAFESAYN